MSTFLQAALSFACIGVGLTSFALVYDILKGKW